MLQTVKKRLYFVVARYFLFWAKIQLLIWRPKTVIVTGSSGKTTTMHLIESQLGSQAHYSHHANSLFGISFDILGMQRETLKKQEWLSLIVKAPLKAFKVPYQQNIYVAEVDCDRPREGALVARLLKPIGVIWLSSSLTHSKNFEHQVVSGTFKTVEGAIADAFSQVARSAKKFVIFNADNKLIKTHLDSVASNKHPLSIKNLVDYQVDASGTLLKTKEYAYSLPELIPREAFYSVEAARLISDELGSSFDSQFKRFKLPAGRSSVLRGIKKTTIIDSSYNSSADAFKAMLQLFAHFKAKDKWLVAGDVLEQGSNEAAVHAGMAADIAELKPDRVVLVGPRLANHTVPALKALGYSQKQLVSFEQPKDALTYLQNNLAGGETILFKGARFLEGIIEHLLVDKKDVARLCRREAVWQQRRKKWGL